MVFKQFLCLFSTYTKGSSSISHSDSEYWFLQSMFQKLFIIQVINRQHLEVFGTEFCLFFLKAHFINRTEGWVRWSPFEGKRSYFEIAFLGILTNKEFSLPQNDLLFKKSLKTSWDKDRSKIIWIGISLEFAERASTQDELIISWNATANWRQRKWKLLYVNKKY